MKRMKDGERGWCWIVGMPNLSGCYTGVGLIFRTIRPLIAAFSYSFTRGQDYYSEEQNANNSEP
jgi:hypothetical protein